MISYAKNLEEIVIDYGLQGREALISRMISALYDCKSELMEVLSEVEDSRACEYEFEAALSTLRGAAAEVNLNDPPTLRSIAVFMPSNVLLYSWVLYVAIPSLYSREVHVRPASAVKSQTAKINDLMGLRCGVRALVHDVSQSVFVSDVVSVAEIVVFTGTYQNAEKVRSTLGKEQVMLFLGSGPNPFLVCQDADIRQAARELVRIRCLNWGQDCLAPDVVFVHSSLRPEFIDTLRREVDVELKDRRSENGSSGFGRIFYEGAFQSATEFMRRYRQNIIMGGRVSFGEMSLEPTIFEWSCEPEHVPMVEFFAPIFNVAYFDCEASMVDRLCSGSFVEAAMGVSVFGATTESVERLTRWYTVTEGSSLLAVDDGNEPLGGKGPMANYSARGGKVLARPILLSREASFWFSRSRGEPRCSS